MSFYEIEMKTGDSRNHPIVQFNIWKEQHGNVRLGQEIRVLV